MTFQGLKAAGSATAGSGCSRSACRRCWKPLAVASGRMTADVARGGMRTEQGAHRRSKTTPGVWKSSAPCPSLGPRGVGRRCGLWRPACDAMGCGDPDGCGDPMRSGHSPPHAYPIGCSDAMGPIGCAGPTGSGDPWAVATMGCGDPMGGLRQMGWPDSVGGGGHVRICALPPVDSGSVVQPDFNRISGPKPSAPSPPGAPVAPIFAEVKEEVAFGDLTHL